MIHSSRDGKKVFLLWTKKYMGGRIRVDFYIQFFFVRNPSERFFAEVGTPTFQSQRKNKTTLQQTWMI